MAGISLKLDMLSLAGDVKKMVKRLKKIDNDGFNKCVDIIEELVKKFKEEAIRRVPVDEGDLERSIATKVTKGLFRTKVYGEVYVAANALAADYAMAMHEWNYNLGPKSAAKQSASGVTVGRKYLERALDENEFEFGMFIYEKHLGLLQ